MKHFLSSAFLLSLLSACTLGHPPDPYLPARSGIEAGEKVTVKQGENVYAIARAHNVSMRDVIVLNDLKPPFTLRVGQTLLLPATGGSSFAGDMPVPEPAPLTLVEKKDVTPLMPPVVASQSLAPVDIPPPQPKPVVAPPPPSPPPPVPPPPPPPPPQQETAAPPSFIWPVQGPVISPYGAKGAGVANDGLDIGAPKGEPVVASASGTVVYAGNEMKGYGNLVLIRHQGDWVTAYAHLERVMVHKDTVLAQGDMLGTVGKTGDAATPRLHFEIRHAEKPVDPAPLVKKAP